MRVFVELKGENVTHLLCKAVLGPNLKIADDILNFYGAAGVCFWHAVGNRFRSDLSPLIENFSRHGAKPTSRDPRAQTL